MVTQSVLHRVPSCRLDLPTYGGKWGGPGGGSRLITGKGEEIQSSGVCSLHLI
jgi:hypothetical protein